MRAWIAVAALATNGYLLGVMVLLSTTVYPSFSAAGDRFASVYSAFTGSIGAPVVAFEFIAFFVTLALYLGGSDWRTHAIVALGVGYFGITFAWHLPAHSALGQGDLSAMPRLLASQWARTILQLVRVGLLASLNAWRVG